MKLNTKLLITYVIVGALLLLVTGYYTQVSLKKETFQSIHDSFIGQLYQVDFAISSFLVDVEYDVKDLVASEIVRTRDDQDFTNFLDADEDTFEYNIGEKEQAIIDVFNNYRTNHPYANSVYMGRENGGFVRSHKRARPTQYDPRQRPWYELAVSDPDKVMRTAPYRSVTTPDVNIGTVKALVDEHNQVYGVVGIDITLRNLTEYISNISVGEDGYIVLLDDNGIVLTGYDEEVRFKKYDEAGLDYFQVVMDNATGYTSFEAEDTESYLFYYTSPALGWKICAVIPVQEVDREVNQFVNRVIGILALSLFLLSALTTVGIHRFIVKPIKELEQSTQTIMQTGDLDHRIAIETGDEIGQLAASFNEMVGSIKRAEGELRASEEKYRSLVENINVGVFRSTAGSPGRLLHANSAAVRILGYDSLTEVMDISMTDLYEVAGERDALVQRLEKGELIKDYEVRLIKKDGTSIWASLSVTVQRDEDGRVKWLEGVIEDITARKRAEDALRRARDELELRVTERTAELSETNVALKQEVVERKRAEEALRQAKEVAEESARVASAANRAKSAFLANMSHELRTPLNAILGFSELMSHDSNLIAEQRDNLEAIGRSGEHLLTLINDVLELSKIEAGQAVVKEVNFDLHHLLAGLEEMFRLRAEGKNLTLAFERTPDVPQYIRADENKLRQVLINLLGNAVKFTQEGGITLRVRCDDERRMPNDQLLPVVGHSSLVFEVEDTGMGIAPDELDAVFDAFVQTASGQQSQRGTGLGVPISREFVRMMGGDLTASSEVGKGTVFEFDVQVALMDQSEIQNLKSEISPRRVVGLEPGQPVYRLLIVEDIATSRKLLTKLLAPLGFEIREALNGQEAVEVWGEWEPHLIWMDMRMPVMDGQEATQRIKNACKDDPSRTPPIIVALTASAFEEERAEILAGGCDDFVRKPFREVDIFDTLTRHLGVRFVYEEMERGDRDEESLRDSLSLSLAGMPPGWLAELRQATVEGDWGRMETLIGQIQDQNPALAERLAELAYNFDHNAILDLIQ